MAEMSLLDILDDENYLNANSATKEAIFNKYAPLDANYAEANEDTKDAIRKRFGVTPLRPVEKPPEDPKDAYPTLRAAADVPLSFARGATSGVKMISDFFGADNPVSQNLQSVEGYLADLMSAQSKKDAQEISRIMADAQDKGVLEQVKAGIKAFSVAPVDILTNAFGTAAPTIVAGLAASTIGAPATATAGLLTAGRVAAGAVGAVSGAGTIKGVIYNDVKQALLDQDVPEDVAEEAAVRAQSYNGENLDSILTGGLIGTIASVTGLEPSATKGILSRIITGSAAKEAVEQTGQQAAKQSFVRGAVSELVPEATQAGQEQLASNIALQREGMDVPTMRGVAGAAALEGVVGGILGGVAKKLEAREAPQTAKAVEDADLLEALNTFNQNQKSKGLGQILRLEDMTGNRVLSLANESRDKIPVLGQILDSDIPRDIKIQQIQKRLAELPQYAAPTQEAEGPLGLPAPPAEGVLTSAPEAFSTAMKSNVPLTNLSVSQGPEGYRVVNNQGQVITQQVRTEREANLLLESLRREQDARNTGVYQQDVKAYERERLPVITEAVARAAREVQTPITSFPMADVKAVDEGTYNAIRELRKGRNLKADVTPAELEKLNVSPAVVSELTLKQKPVTGGGGTIRPEYEQEILGPRPSEPVQTARTAEQLRQSTEKVPGKIGRKKVMFAPSLAGAEVTQTQPLSQFEKPDMVTLYRSSGMMDPSQGVERWTTDRKVAERFGPVNTVSIPRRDVERFSAAFAGAPQTDVVFDRRGRTPTQIAKQMPVSQQGLEQEYSLAEDEARAPKQQKKIKNLLKPEKGEAPPAGFRPAVGKQPRVERGTYPEIKGEEPPSAEAVAAAEKVINDRIARIEKQGKQGEKIAQALRDALNSGDFTTPQMMIAFESASISARLLGTTASAPHDFKFVNRLIETSSGTAYGVRRLPIATNVNGMIELATIPDVLIKGRNTPAHEAFHVLQDVFNEYDKPSARIIRDAFRGALTVDNINPTLLNKLRSMVDPDTGKTYDVLVKENIKDYYDDSSPQKRERELQAYVFAALEDARTKGVPVGNLGGAFVRFLNFYRAFKERLGNYLNGQGYRNVVDVFERISTGEQQRGLGKAEKAAGAGVIQRGKFEPEDLAKSDVSIVDKVPGLKAVWPHLTPDEREGLVTTSAKNLVKLFREMPSPQEMASVAYSGRAKRGWYINSARALVKIFGTVDSRRFAALLAATSPQTSVESNLVNALNIWSNWIKAGRPTDNSSILRIMGNSVQGDKGEESILDAWKNNTLRALATPDSELNNIQISGPKVDSFMRNLLGVVEEVTNDAWMANYSGVKQEVFKGRKSGADAFGNVYTKSSGYISMSVAARKAADILTRTTGNKWTPAEIQETVWSWAKALYEMRASKGEGRTTRDILTQGSLTGDIINSVPDFEKLFVEGVYRQILEGSGYAKQIRKLGRDVASRSAGAAGNLGGVSALESQGSGFAEDAFRRNLFRAARRIEQLYQTRLERGETDVSEDLSLAEDPVLQPRELDDVSLAAQEEIQAGGLAPGLAGNANTYNKTFDSVREFFNPFALVTNSKMLFQFRNRTYGKISISEERARKTSDIIGKATPEDRKATYTYLTTRDGNPNTIKDPKIRAAAVTAKKEINKIGQELVDNKFMTQESYDKFYDQYLPRIYLYHELTGRGMTTPLGGRSKMEYVMERDITLSKEERDLLGEIKDPAFLTYVAMARPARDLAVSEYLNNLLSYSEAGGSNTPWVLPRSLVKWNGHNITPYALLSEANDIRQFVLPVAKANDPQQARSILANINKMEKIARDRLTEIGIAGPSFDPKKYQKMPEDKRYGFLAGAVVQKGIYNDLVGTFIPVRVQNRPILERVFGDENSALGKAVGLWKLGKTTLNVPTQVRNAVSNMIALTLFTDIPIYRIPSLMKRALTEMTKDTQNWKDAQEYGIKGGTMSSAELRGIFERTLQRIKKYDDNKTKDNPLIHALGSARIAGTTIVEKAGDMYQEVEVLFKFMAFLNERQKQNFVRKPSLISEAVDTANEALFDYTLVNPNVRWLRNAPLGLPFVTYLYKVVPKLIETAYKHPMRFAPYIALATALPLYTMAELDLTPDELEAMRKSLSDNIRNNGSLFFLPYRDEQGNIAYVDLAPFLPWAMIVNPLIKAVYYGDVKGGGLEALRPINPFESSPISTAIAAIATGIDNFTGKPIMDPRDTPTAQGLSMVSYIWNQAMPPMFSVNLNDMDQSSGAIARVYNSLTDSGTDVTKRGLPKPDDVLTAARLLGFNAEPLKADMQRAANMNYMVSQIRKRESYRAEISKNQAMTPEKRRAKIQEINEQIREDYKKLQEYGAETALASSVASRQRKLAKEEEQ